ncbi:MAG: glycine cleavage system protein R, partial [Gammaproteobacteria bacterium]|nr:glycine cleavage system protein R [Gammaproteobacteria bacterium]
LAELEQSFSDLIFNSRYTQARPLQPALSYKVSVHALDHPGIVYNLARFFSERNLNIENLSTESYSAPHTGTKMFAVELKLNIPEDIAINKLRDAFIEHCDALNLDASFEPEHRQSYK